MEIVMQVIPRTTFVILITSGFVIASCADNSGGPMSNDEVGDGDADPTGDPTSDGPTGDGEPTGDGDGDPTGDGDQTGDGDGDPTGDGDQTGDGDADPSGDGDSDPTNDGDGLCEGTCGAPECGICPEGPLQVMVDTYMVDATEITGAQYGMFLAIDFDPEFLPEMLPAGCESKTDFMPPMFPDEPPEAIPVVNVDWCDAAAYCAWAGKRLCGAIGGGPAPLNEVQNPATNEWYRACTGGGISNYPYGLMYDSSACNTIDAGWNQLTDVGGLPNCQGGYEGIFDMSGNVWEWTNSCNDLGECQRRGGSLFSNGPNARCAIDSVRPRDFREDSQGFRCCGG
jgi:sulfatase modifying factor 1